MPAAAPPQSAAAGVPAALSAEQLLLLLDRAGSAGLPDTRALYPVAESAHAVASSSSGSADDAGARIEAELRARADWQLGLQATLSSLASRDMVSYAVHEQTTLVLTPEGYSIARDGSHEARLWRALPADPEQGVSMAKLGVSGVCGMCSAAPWLIACRCRSSSPLPC